ncbi:MAG: hypothetical protein ACR5LG_03225 [Sodalis sp. (in: enterobacteria)]|uniref:hypothetical protein n=1 Tax=Sodalis sp. (in: enterobacteria) TaxID=1898979 RepID=UPI003F3A080C
MQQHLRAKPLYGGGGMGGNTSRLAGGRRQGSIILDGVAKGGAVALQPIKVP